MTMKDYMKKDKEEKKEEGKKEDPLEKLASKIRGKVVLVWGEPFVGKSLLSLNLSKYFEKPALLLIDTNYPREYFEINSNLQIIKADTFQKVILLLENLKSKENDLIIVDSVTTLASEAVIKSQSFLQGELSPRTFLVLRYLFDAITRKAAVLKENGKTVIIIAHSSFDWKNNVYRPSVNRLCLRNVDILLKISVENEKRKIELEERKYEGTFTTPEVSF